MKNLGGQFVGTAILAPLLAPCISTPTAYTRNAPPPSSRPANIGRLNARHRMEVQVLMRTIAITLARFVVACSEAPRPATRGLIFEAPLVLPLRASREVAA